MLLSVAGCKQTSSDAPATTAPPPPTFGGKEAIVLKRLQTYSGEVPEFTGMTVLPGRGMDVVSIKAYLPGRGETEILSVPPLDKLSASMSGTGISSQGAASALAGGVFMAPFANPLSGTVSADGNAVTLGPRGKSVTLPVVGDPDRPSAPPLARFGLLGPLAATQTQFNNMPDGSEFKATFESEGFHGRWPGKLEFTVSTLLSGRAIDLVMTATNNGQEAVPVSLGWYPRFAIPSGKRAQARLRLPMSVSMRPYTASKGSSATSGNEIKAETGLNLRGGSELGAQDIDATLVHLRPALFDNGPTVEIRDPAADYGLKIVGMSTSVNGILVSAPTDKPWIVIAPVANLTDLASKPLDNDKADDLMLAPGKTMQWRVRLELFSPSAQAKPGTAPSPFDPAPARP